MKYLFVVLVLFSTNGFSQNTKKIENEYHYRIEVGATSPSFFSEYSKNILYDSIIEIELAVIGTNDNIFDTNKYGGKYAISDIRNKLFIYQEEKKIEIFKKGDKYFCNIQRNSPFLMKFIIPARDQILEEIKPDVNEYGISYQLKKIVIEEGKGDSLLIPIIKSKRPLLNKEIAEIIEYIRNFGKKQKKPNVFKNNTAVLSFEY